MGQRSQIYIMWNVTDKGTPIHGLIARYYGWNYGERMISRARAIIEEIRDEFMPYKFLFADPNYVRKLERLCDVNFDMRDLQIGQDIIKEIKEDFPDHPECLFEEDCNDGQLFISVTDEGIKYGFMEYFDTDRVMDAEAYMKWDVEDPEARPNWHVPDEFLSSREIKYTEKNIRKIRKMAKLMSIEEIHQFIDEALEYVKENNA